MNQFYLLVETEGGHLCFNHMQSALHCNSLCIFRSDYKRHSFENIIKDCDDGTADNVLLRMHEDPRLIFRTKEKKLNIVPGTFNPRMGVGVGGRGARWICRAH